MDPTMGRIVFYTPGDPNDVSAVEAPAIVSRVNSDGTLDLTVFPPGNSPYPASNVQESESGGSELAKWCWPIAAPTGSQPEGAGSGDTTDTPSPGAGDGEPDPAPPASEGEGASTGDGSGEGDQGGGEAPAPTTSEASEKPLYKIGGDVVPDGFTTSGLETPEGEWLWHFAGDTAGQPHTFDVSTDDAIVLYADADDNEQPVQPATPVEPTA